MGSWSLIGSTGGSSPLITTTNYGTNFYATFRLKYTPSLFGGFTEAPLLEWNEVIMMNDHIDRETWTFADNMYTHKPGSPTLNPFPKRYIRAYESVFSIKTLDKGSVSLLDKDLRAVPPSKLDQATDNAGKANSVRKYLKSHGGVLEMTFHDIPSIALGGSTPQNKERLLAFDCGFDCPGPRVRCWQYLRVNSAQPQGNWTMQFHFGSAPPVMSTTGFKRVDVPAGVGTPNAGVAFPGEYLGV
jgi:hypothetical protein